MYLSKATNSNIMIGTMISFIGLVMIDKQIRTLHLLCPFISNDSEMHNADRTPLYVAFEAAC